METPIYEKDYGIDLIPKIKNPNLKKFYEILGVERSTYFIGELLKDFDQFKKMDWDKLTILHIKKFIKFIGG